MCEIKTGMIVNFYCGCVEKTCETTPDEESKPEDPVKVETPSLKKNLKDILTTEAWNLTTPGKSPENPTKPQTVEFPELNTFEDKFFKLTTEGLSLRVPVDGQTTPNSKYSRCEFRELNLDKSKASWSTSKGTHIMEVITRVESLPKNKPQVCLAQIHDAKDDICMVRYEDGKIIVSGNHFTKKHLLDVRLNSDIKITITCSKTIISIKVNDQVFELPPINTDGCYYKAGNYLQSNLSVDPVGEGIVLLKYLSVKHA